MKSLSKSFSMTIRLGAFVSVTALALHMSPKSVEAQTLTSYLSGKTAAGHYLKFKNAGAAAWTLSDLRPCEKYPCDINDHTINTTLAAKWLSSLTTADGNTVIGLSNGMIVTFVNNGMVPPRADGPRAESYWQLEIPSIDGAKPEVVRLSFAPTID